MEISWFGHSCFHIVDSLGRSIITDPPAKRVGYDLPDVRADVVLVSHDHYDHNNVEAIGGSPAVIREPKEHTASGITFYGILSHHDDKGGTLRGENIIFTFALDGIRICHLGDLGHILSADQIREIGPVDVLMIPVGGVFTLDASGASKVVEKIRPKVVIPMHFKTKALKMNIESSDRFLKGRKPEGPSKSLTIMPGELRSDIVRTVIFEY